MRVLVIDDDEAQLRAAAGLLRLNGFEVATALSSEQAFAQIDASHFDGALVDLMMPRTNGLELLRGLRTRAPYLRLVLTSSFPLAHGQIERLGLDDVRFVPKPPTSEALHEAFEAPLPRVRRSDERPVTR